MTNIATIQEFTQWAWASRNVLMKMNYDYRDIEFNIHEIVIETVIKRFYFQNVAQYSISFNQEKNEIRVHGMLIDVCRDRNYNACSIMVRDWKPSSRLVRAADNTISFVPNEKPPVFTADLSLLLSN